MGVRAGGLSRPHGEIGAVGAGFAARRLIRDNDRAAGPEQFRQTFANVLRQFYAIQRRRWTGREALAIRGRGQDRPLQRFAIVARRGRDEEMRAKGRVRVINGDRSLEHGHEALTNVDFFILAADQHRNGFGATTRRLFRLRRCLGGRFGLDQSQCKIGDFSVERGGSFPGGLNFRGQIGQRIFGLELRLNGGEFLLERSLN